jgi:hypothetical protein
LDSIHIWRLGILSLTISIVRYGDELRDVALINRKPAVPALLVWQRGSGTPSLPAKPFSCKAEIEPCFSAGDEPFQ